MKLFLNLATIFHLSCFLHRQKLALIEQQELCRVLAYCEHGCCV